MLLIMVFEVDEDKAREKEEMKEKEKKAYLERQKKWRKWKYL